MLVVAAGKRVETVRRKSRKKIVKIIPYEKWFYVQTDSNPADLGSHGVTAEKLIGNKLWSEGPEFLKSPEWLSLNVLPNIDVQEALEKRKTKIRKCFFRHR